MSFGLLASGDYYKFSFFPHIFVKYPTVCWSHSRGEEDRLQKLAC